MIASPKMDFGQLNPQLPFDSSLAPLTRADLARISKETTGTDTGAGNDSPSLFIGAPQWTVPAWKGKTYPKGTKPSDFLDAYSRQWNSIELNSSFYSSPSAEQVRAWAARTPKDFRFFVKVHQDLSHDREIYGNLEILRSKITAFQTTWRNLGSHLGGFFLQLPPYFSTNDLPKLRTWLQMWKSVSNSPAATTPFDLNPFSSASETIPTATSALENLHVEFRHESWFQNRRLAPAAEALLVEMGTGAVCTDTPGRRDASHATLTTDFWMIRFLAQSTENHEAILERDFERLDAWALRLAELTKRGLRGFAFFAHTPEHLWVPDLSTRFAELFREKLGESDSEKDFHLSIRKSLRAPTPINEIEPDQLALL